MSKKQIDVYRTGIYLRLSQGDEDVDGLEKKESNSISNQKLCHSVTVLIFVYPSMGHKVDSCNTDLHKLFYTP